MDLTGMGIDIVLVVGMGEAVGVGVWEVIVIIVIDLDHMNALVEAATGPDPIAAYDPASLIPVLVIKVVVSLVTRFTYGVLWYSALRLSGMLLWMPLVI
ncbi:hypothetical protein BHE74_00029472 [Ensete ventricosum]|nr:hypothetical protein BHE74_00029472 [Ensete ventricosum]RZR89365.1 hypothetical protein BHM03_00017068 [Ensete ventricosum]